MGRLAADLGGGDDRNLFCTVPALTGKKPPLSGASGSFSIDRRYAEATNNLYVGDLTVTVSTEKARKKNRNNEYSISPSS
jgi:hypothetical protein